MTAAFAGKAVIVTGSASGIGRATALLFASQGAQVVAADRDAGVEATAQLDPEGRVIAHRCDCGDEAEVQAMIAMAAERLGRLDVIVANAGVLGGLAGLFDLEVSVFAEVLRVNLIGPFLAIKHGGPHLRAHGGAIVCTASVAGLRSGAGGVAYSASKAGLINLVKLAAQQFAGTGVRVNAVCPGLIETGMTQAVFDAARSAGKADRLGQLNPLKRSGLAEEVAAAIAFLASDQAGYINGHALVVDGGLASSLPVARPSVAGKTAF